MNHSFTSTLFVLLITSICFSQNLVLNGSFEDTEKCAEDLQQFDKNVKYWNTPTSGSTDLFNNCAAFLDLKPTNNYQGSQLPFHGENYAGCYFYGIDDYREYIQGSLSEPLIKGSRYKLSLEISLADKSDIAIKDIQVMFTDTIIKSWGTYPITKNRIRNKNIETFMVHLSNDDEYLNNKETWIEISIEFIAKKSANYFTIGNFNSNKLTDKKNQRFLPRIRKSYYYIDEVKLIDLEKKIPKVILKKRSTIKTDSIQKVNEFKINSIYTLKSIQFEFDKSTLIENSTKELDELIIYLKQNPELKIQINGHTDYLGKAAYNQKLSEDRAKSVADYLISKGISKNRITSKGYGESQPIDPNEPEDAQAKNRRVEFILSN